MADSLATQKSLYPLPVYNFKVVVDGESVSFSDVTGMALEYETVTYRHGLSFMEGEQITVFGFPKYVPLTLKKGTVPRNSFLYGWLTGGQSRTIDISLCDESGDAVVIWHVKKAIATKLSPAELTASGNEVAIDTLDLMVSGISVEYR